MGSLPTATHATDPVCGKLLNAFDLVRLHKFRELDENVGLDTPPGKLPSFKAMSDLAWRTIRSKRSSPRSASPRPGWTL